MKPFLKPVSNACLVILIMASAKVCFNLYGMLVLEGRGILNPDVLIYLTIGRGILNSLHIYRDLFESKPPGIFFLSAISLILGRTALMRMLEVGSLFLIPISLTILGWRHSRFLALTSFCFGGLLTLWIQENGGGLQTEIFSLLFGTLYVLNIQGKTWPRIILNGFFLMLVIAFREPFLLGILAASLLFSRTWKDFLNTFILPLSIALVLGAILLIALGIFGDFTQIYLPAMLIHRIQGGTLDPLAIRMIWVHRLFSSLTIYSSMPLLGYALGLLWIYAIVSKVKLTRKGMIMVLIAVLYGVLLLHEYFVLFQLFRQAGAVGISPSGVLFDSSFIFITLAYAVGTLIYIAFLLYIGNLRILMSVGCGFLALLCLSLAIGIGGYTPNYLLFIVPAVIVAYLFLLESAKLPLLLLFSSLLCVVSFMYIPRNHLSMTLYSDTQTLSLQLDHIMDACGFDRYALIGGYSKFAFAKHMPIGPMFSPYFHEYLGLDNPLFLRTYQAIDQQAGILLQQDPLPADPYPLPNALRYQFSETSPACAKGLSTPIGFTVLYRIK